ncbi:MAG: putative quinol monooxygenase [Acidobacteriaceae bacterium]|nr:putative quinol monooxygenase [Acidobacteriaceae bacterium]
MSDQKTKSKVAKCLLAGGLIVAGMNPAVSLGQEAVTPSPEKVSEPPVVMFNTFHLKRGEETSFLTTMRTNARHARKEKGNIIFDVYQPEDGASDLYLVERWSSQRILDKHMQTAPLKAVMEHVKTATTEAPNLEYLKEVSSPLLPKAISSPAATRNVVVTLFAKPERQSDLILALQTVTEHSRSAPGNLSFNVFQDVSDANRFVIVERWVSVEAHEKHLTQPYIQPLQAAFEQDLREPAVNGRLLLKDVFASESVATTR